MASLFHRRCSEGKSLWGPGDTYTFLVTGEESDNAYLSMLAIVPMKMILTFTPAGIERFFAETLERAYDLTQPGPDNIAEVSARYAEAAPRYGMTFFLDA